MGNHRTYTTYEFEDDPPQSLVTLTNEHDELFNETHVWQDVDGAWRIQKPVSRLEIRPEPPHDEVMAFLEEFSSYFHWTFDGYFLYFSRFPELADLASRCETPAMGILFGYDPYDVAQYIAEREGDFIGEPDRGKHTIERKAIIDDRETCREEFEREGLF